MLAAAFGFLRGVSPVVWVVAALLAWGGFHRHQARAAVATLKAEKAQADVDNANAAADKALEEKRRIGAKQKVIDDALKKRDASAAAARAADARSVQLNAQIDALQAASGAGDPTAGGQCEAAETRASVYAGLLREAEGFARGVVAEAEGYRAAGEACERSYESLINRASAPQPTRQ